ncbi:winged helix-turn-helix transcriptional regulator [Sphingobium sp. ZW T5_29]|uniref:winged helix-turn-helix transcriptional regulator n=1 Tax=Sphingobium sp. ZW T5_29 TaxID=3378077 RepID=UPI0038535E00
METIETPGYHPRTLEVMDLVGDKWTLLVTYRLGGERMRFSELRRQAEPISAKMLSQTLRRLESFGMVGREVINTKPPSVEYRLTELGGSFLSAASVICAWTRDNIVALDRAHASFVKQEVAAKE